MQLRAVFEGIPTLTPLPPVLGEQQVHGLAYDSRKVGPGYLFFAFPGSRTDGAQFARAAMEKGALAVVSDRPAPAGFSSPWIQVTHGRHALALAARNFFNKPDERVILTAVTGTNGKTTSTMLLDSILRAAGKVTALIGTIEYHLAGRVLPAVNTTPESLDLFRIFHELEQAGGTHATLEASSHALDLGRIYAMQFHTAGFTNFTRDHLDYHQTMEAYFAAKQLLFRPRSGPPPRFAVLNADDELVRNVETASETELFLFSTQPPEQNRDRKGAAWIYPAVVDSRFDGLRMTVSTGKRCFQVESPLVGHINVYNILLACAVALTHGIGEQHIQQGIQQMQRVPGRFERVEQGQPFMVVVDYAHMDDALRHVISVARGMKPRRVITLFGCGGDRDRSKRPLMGMAAAELSDFVVLTSVNPRSEDPLDIMNAAMVGIRRYDTPLVAEPDREKAIRIAIGEAKPGDVGLLAGKGHETYQVLKDRTIHFDDREAVRAILRELYRSGKSE